MEPLRSARENTMKFILSMALSGLLTVSPANDTDKTRGTDNGTARQPVLLELFTSEGCSSCPPADKLLQVFDQRQPVDGADLIVLSEHVDYWNHGGWADPFSSPVFSARQQEYANKLGLDSVYTPQLIVDGQAELVGSNVVEARREITKAIRQNKIPVTLTNAVRKRDHVSVHLELGAVPPGKRNATVYLALADSEDHSQVAHGENAGRALTHVAVVRTLLAVGTVGSSGFAKDVNIPLKSAGQNGLRIIAFVQDGASRKILGAAQQKLELNPKSETAS